MESNILFNAIFQQSAIAMTISSLDRKFVYVNQAFSDLIGYKKEELINESFITYTHLDDVDSSKLIMDKLLNSEIHSFQLEKRFIHKNGDIVWGLLSVNTINDDNGAIKFTIGQIQDITEKKRTEAKLIENEKRYRIIAENSNDRIIILEPDGRYKYIYPALQNQLGYDPKDIVGLVSPIDFIYIDDQPLFNKALKIAKDSHISTTIHYRVRHLSGHYLWTESNIKWIEEYDEILLICRDITERKEIEEKLKASNQININILESITDGFVVLDKEDRFIYVNKAISAFLDRNLAQLLGYNWLEVFPQLQNTTFMKNYYHVKKERKDLKFECYLEFLDAWFIVRMYPTKDIVTIYFLNITKEKHLEEAFSESEERYRSLVEASPDTILVQIDDKLEYINDAGVLLLGANNKEELVGRSVWDFLLKEEHEMICDQMNKLLSGELKSTVLRIKNLRLDGTVLDVSASVTCITYNGQKAIQAIVRDITELKVMQEWLRKTEKLSLVGQLAAGVAHEIRNPMTSIKGFIQLVKSTKEWKDYYTDIILSELERTEAIIYEFLSLAKPSDAKALVKTDCISILNKVIQLLDAQALMYDVKIDFSFDCHHFIECDDNQMKQVFINIIQNAIEASQPNGTIYVTVKEKDDHNIIISVKDEGCGIPKDRLKKLGEPFYSTKEKGTGLGLLVTYKIIEGHCGKLKFSSEEGAGTTVEILLPKYVALLV